MKDAKKMVTAAIANGYTVTAVVAYRGEVAEVKMTDTTTPAGMVAIKAKLGGVLAWEYKVMDLGFEWEEMPF